jgi:hypothetical protein
MPKYIVHYEGKFFDWSTIVDAPTSYAMTREEYEKEYLLEYGRKGVEQLPERLERAIQNGTSSHRKMSFAELITGNRAGPNESEASIEEILKEVLNPPK